MYPGKLCPFTEKESHAVAEGGSRATALAESNRETLAGVGLGDRAQEFVKAARTRKRRGRG